MGTNVEAQLAKENLIWYRVIASNNTPGYKEQFSIKLT